MNNLKQADVEIGISTINYDEQGKVISADFAPTMKVKSTEDIVHELEKIKASMTSENVSRKASILLGGWFAKMNDIELRDFETTEIVSQLMECIRWDNGNIRKCVIKSTFKHK